MTDFTYKAYFHLELGISDWGKGEYEDAINNFKIAIETSAFSSRWDIHAIYEDFVVVC